MHDLIRRAEAALDKAPVMLLGSFEQLTFELLAALKAQQPSSAGQTAPAVTQGDNGGKGFTVTQIHGKEATLAGGGGGVVGSGGGATYLVEVQGGGKAQQPAPVEDDGLPPLPEPFAVHELWGQNVNVYSADQLRRAQREAMEVERGRCFPVIDEALRLAVERTRADLGPTGDNYPAVRKLLAFAEQAIRQVASHD